MDNSYRLRSYLMDGETVLWQGESHGKMRNRADSGHIGTIVGGIAFMAFALFWTLMAFSLRVTPFALFGVAFILIGAYTAFGVTLWHKRKLKDCYYVVTDMRILIILKNETVSIDYRMMTDVQIVNGKEGRGWLYLRRSRTGNGHYVNGRYVENAGTVLKDSLQDIDDVDNVFRIVMNQRQIVMNNHNQNNMGQGSDFGNMDYSGFNKHYGNKP